jgi:hypothetical protein
MTPMIVVGESAAVESARDPGWQVNAGGRLGGEVLGGEDGQVRRAAVGVVHGGEDSIMVNLHSAGVLGSCLRCERIHAGVVLG